MGFFNDEDYFNIKLTKNEVEYWIEKSIVSALDFFNNFSVSSIEENERLGIKRIYDVLRKKHLPIKIDPPEDVLLLCSNSF